MGLSAGATQAVFCKMCKTDDVREEVLGSD